MRHRTSPSAFNLLFGLVVSLALASAMLAVARPAFAQTSQSPTIFVRDLEPSAGIDGKPADPKLTQMLSEALGNAIWKRFRCANVLTMGDVRALLSLAKDQQMLGTAEQNQVRWQDIGDVMGGAGTLVYGSFGEADGQYYVNIKTIDPNHPNSAKSNTLVTAEAGDQSRLLDLIDQAVAAMNVGVCDPRWTGHVDMVSTETHTDEGGHPPMMLANRTRNENGTVKTTRTTTDTVGVYVHGRNPNSLAASITHRYQLSMESHTLLTMDVNCRRTVAQPDDWRGWRSTTDERYEENGLVDTKDTVGVSLDADGKYTISVPVPGMKTRVVIDKTHTSPAAPCEGPVTESSMIISSATGPGGAYTVHGQTDLKQRNIVLAGSETQGPTTIKWELKREDGPPAKR